MQKTPLNTMRIIWFTFITTPIAQLYLLSKEADKSAWLSSLNANELFNLSDPAEIIYLVISIMALGVAYTLPRSPLNQKLGEYPVYICRLVACEIAINFGYVIAMQSQNITKFYPLAVAGTFGLILLFPRSLPTRPKNGQIGLS